jgi:hypothetical protein
MRLDISHRRKLSIFHIRALILIGSRSAAPQKPFGETIENLYFFA